jgi:hypothetical protein
MRWALAASIFALLALDPRPCGAWTIAPEVAPFSGLTGSLTGEVQFLSAPSGLPAGGVALVGAPGATDVSFTFRIVLDPASQPLEDVVFTPGLGAASAAGWIPGAGEPDGLADLASASTFLGSTTLTFSGPVPAGGATNLFFVSFPQELFDSESARSLSLAFYEPGNSFATAGTILQVVPEPSTHALVLLGLALLCRRARRP